ncbi:hypothetical protein [Bradyrhizobium sp. CCGB12]|uniref:hypothetical protein n=1 Tax=Bradyrhizobium sp. CCGB12 TaxID=2949632 RepID=UPI0035C083BA
MTMLVGHGLFGLATTYFGSQLVLDLLLTFAAAPRVKLAVYPGVTRSTRVMRRARLFAQRSKR